MTHLLLTLILLAIIGPPIWRWRQGRRLAKAIRRQAKFTGTYDLRYTPGMTDYMMTKIIAGGWGYENGVVLTRKQIRELRRITPTHAETSEWQRREWREQREQMDRQYPRSDVSAAPIPRKFITAEQVGVALSLAAFVGFFVVLNLIHHS